MEWVNDPIIIVLSVALAAWRIWLEMAGFDFTVLPLTARLPVEQARQIHRWGFYLSVLYLCTFVPAALLG